MTFYGAMFWLIAGWLLGVGTMVAFVTWWVRRAGAEGVLAFKNTAGLWVPKYPANSEE